MWGRPTADETQTIVGLLALYEHAMAPKFSVLLDTHAISEIDPSAARVMLAWVLEHRQRFMQRIRLQANVIQAGPVGFAFIGILSAFGQSHPFRAFSDTAEAFRVLDEVEGPSVCTEVQQIVSQIRGTSVELESLRALLAHRPGLSLGEAATLLGLSRRSLQRVLSKQSVSYREEVTQARFYFAQERLRKTDGKIAAVATSVGLTERALAQLFQRKTGISPGDWRAKERSRTAG